jgi:hypothetical protein
MYGWQARPCMNLHDMYRWFGVVPQGGEVFFLILLCGDFRSSLLRFSWRSFEYNFLGFLVGVTYEDLVPLWLVTLPPNLS